MYDSIDQSQEKSRFRYTDTEYKNPREQEIAIRQLAIKKAKKFLSLNKSSLKEFEGLEQFRESDIQRDSATTEKLKARYDEAEKTDLDKQWSTIQEAIILEQFELSDWFGSEASTIKPTEHADYVQGVDGVLKFDDLNLAFDASYKKQPYDKVHKIKLQNQSGELKLITYFSDEETGFKGSVNFPIIVLGFDKENLMKLTQQWLGGQVSMTERNKTLAENPIQMLTIHQALMQLSTFELDAKQNPNMTEQEHLFNGLKNKIIEIYNHKIEAHPEFKKLMEDKFTEQLIADTARDYGFKIEDIKNNIWPKVEPRKIFKIARPQAQGKSLDQNPRAAA